VRLVIKPSTKERGLQGKRVDTSLACPKSSAWPELNAMQVGQSVFMSKREFTDADRYSMRYAVLRANASSARVFVCQWIQDRTTLEIARIG